MSPKLNLQKKINGTHIEETPKNNFCYLCFSAGVRKILAFVALKMFNQKMKKKIVWSSVQRIELNVSFSMGNLRKWLPWNYFKGHIHFFGVSFLRFINDGALLLLCKLVQKFSCLNLIYLSFFLQEKSFSERQ